MKIKYISLISNWMPDNATYRIDQEVVRFVKLSSFNDRLAWPRRMRRYLLNDWRSFLFFFIRCLPAGVIEVYAGGGEMPGTRRNGWLLKKCCGNMCIGFR